MAKKYFKIEFSKYILIVFVSLLGTIFSQEVGSIQSELQKVEDEFKEESSADEIPQSELLEVMRKPGNEHLLERLKGLDSNIDVNEGEEFDMMELKDEKKLEDDEKKLEDDEKKLQINTPSEIIYDRALYYESIKDFYGYKIFFHPEEEDKPRANVTSARNTRYVIAPGDQFILAGWGDVQFQDRLNVNPEGTVFVNHLGVVVVHGLTVDELEKKLRRLLAKRYLTIDPPNGKPTTFIDVSLSKLTTVNVSVNGEVILPGTFEMSPNSSIISALVKAYGVSAKGTLRNIRLIRNGKIIRTLDVYDYLLSGKSVNEVPLNDGDNIFVGNRSNTISVKGEVLHSLKFELKDNETLKDLIKYSGGLLSSASADRIKIERIEPLELRTSPVVNTNILDYEFTFVKNGKIEVDPIKLFDRDIVTVFAVPKMLTDYIAISGAVYRQGRYNYSENMQISDLLKKTGGILADAYTQKIELVRTHLDHSKEYKSLNINKEANFQLKSLDSLHIYSTRELKSRKVVIISGYIKNPGFEYLSDSMRVSDLIFSKGGILDEWRKNRTYLLHAELTRYNKDGVTTKIIPLNLNEVLNENPTEDIFLKDGDQLRIFNLGMVYKEGVVKISGYVKNEGEYKLSTNMTVEDLIRKANGFKEGAYEYKASVFRMNDKANSRDSLALLYDVPLVKDFLKTGIGNKNSLTLSNKDHVVIRRNPKYHELRKINLSGEVLFPGTYALLNTHETLRDVIERAGGLNPAAYLDGITFTRDSIKIVSDFNKALNGNIKNDILLVNGDNINIPKRPGVIKVEGFVYTPGLIKYRNDWSLEEFIEAAGGRMSDLEFRAGNAVVYYPGGNAKVDDGWMFSPSVKEGSTIVVPKIQRLEKREWTSELRNWLGVMTSTLTVILLIAAVQ